MSGRGRVRGSLVADEARRMLSDAQRWLLDHGFLGLPATQHVNEEGQLIGDLLADDFGGSVQYWIFRDDPLVAEPIDGWAFEDATAIVLDEGEWNATGFHGVLLSGRQVLSNIEMDQEAERVSPAGWMIRRGIFYDSDEDRADRWYPLPFNVMKRSGEGFQTIRDALDWIYRRRRHA